MNSSDARTARPSAWHEPEARHDEQCQRQRAALIWVVVVIGVFRGGGGGGSGGGGGGGRGGAGGLGSEVKHVRARARVASYCDCYPPAIPGRTCSLMGSLASLLPTCTPGMRERVRFFAVVVAGGADSGTARAAGSFCGDSALTLPLKSARGLYFSSFATLSASWRAASRGDLRCTCSARLACCCFCRFAFVAASPLLCLES